MKGFSQPFLQIQMLIISLFSYLWNFKLSPNSKIKIKILKMKVSPQDFNFQKSRRESKTMPDFYIWFQQVANNIGGWLKVFPSYLVCSQICLNFPMDDCQFHYLFPLDDYHFGRITKSINKTLLALHCSSSNMVLKIHIHNRIVLAKMTNTIYIVHGQLQQISIE